MSKFDVEKFIKSLEQSKTAEAADKAFSKVFALPPSERKAVADAIENIIFVRNLERFEEPVRQRGVAEIKKFLNQAGVVTNVKGEVVRGAELVTLAQTTAHILYNIRELKGDKTSPLVKAFVAAAEKLTDEEYNSKACIDKPMCAVVDAIAKEEGLLKPNPLRKNKNGPRA